MSQQGFEPGLAAHSELGVSALTNSAKGSDPLARGQQASHVGLHIICIVVTETYVNFDTLHDDNMPSWTHFPHMTGLCEVMSPGVGLGS